MKANTNVLAIIAVAVALSCTARLASAAAEPMSTPATLVRNGDIKLNNIFVSGTLEGTVTFSSAGTQATGGVTIAAASARANAAQFTISGQPGYAFAITVPASCLLSDASENSMDVTDFISTPAIGTLDNMGTQIVQVGATLHINAAQPNGIYANASDISVTVNYN